MKFSTESKNNLDDYMRQSAKNVPTLSTMITTPTQVDKSWARRLFQCLNHIYPALGKIIEPGPPNGGLNAWVEEWALAIRGLTGEQIKNGLANSSRLSSECPTSKMFVHFCLQRDVLEELEDQEQKRLDEAVSMRSTPEVAQHWLAKMREGLK